MLRLVDLLELADSMGVRVEWCEIGGTCRGAYSKTEQVIYLNQRLTRPQAVFTLAHELSHAVRGDDGAQLPTVEREVDRRAALMIFNIKEYAQAERLYGSDPRTIARELDTIPRAVEAFQEVLGEGNPFSKPEIYINGMY